MPPLATPLAPPVLVNPVTWHDTLLHTCVSLIRCKDKHKGVHLQLKLDGMSGYIWNKQPSDPPSLCFPLFGLIKPSPFHPPF